MKDINVPLMQVQYEVLHESVADIAKEHEVTAQMVEYAIEQHGWTQKQLTDSEQASAIDVVNSERQVALEAVHTLRQGVLDPHYIKIEAALVAKAIDVINGILPSDPTASKRLKEITEILSTMRPTKAMQDQTQSNDIRVMVMTHVGDQDAVQSRREDVEVVINGQG